MTSNPLVFGVATSDSSYVTQKTIDGVMVVCPFYRKWISMLTRCYSKNYQLRHPTYKGCSVSDEWLLFSAFKSWMKKQDWDGKQLDKDLLISGNKIYSPDRYMNV